MISSTPRFSYLKGLAAALSVVFCALSLSHAGLEALARWAEAKPGHYLWRSDDELLLLSPAQFQRSGKNRLMIFGASETAEGFVDSEIERRLPGVTVENLAYDGAMIDDLIFQLKYLERIYGPEAIPSDIVIGLSNRFLSNIAIPRTRLFKDAINKYSPGNATGNGPSARVQRKSAALAAVSWLRFRLHQTERYRNALRAVWMEAASAIGPEWARKRDLRDSLVKANFWSRIRGTDAEIRGRLADIDHWKKTHVWKASEHQDMVKRELAAITEFAHRHNSRLYLVNVPLFSVNRSMFAPGIYEDYLQVVDANRGDADVLDLGELLAPEEFSDAVHANRRGALHISRATADFIGRTEEK